jgi:hypothetical protein
MIKPFTILDVRDEPCGGKTVFFRVRKVEQVSDSRKTTQTMETSTHVEADQDIDAHVFNILQQSGWL